MAVKGDAPVRRIDFDDLALLSGRRVTARPARDNELEGLIDLAARSIPHLAAAAPAVRRVHARNENAVWAVHGRDRSQIGVIALLLLNEDGWRALQAGSLDASDPDVDLLVRPGEAGAAVYLWAVALPHFAIDALGVVSLWLRNPAFASADIYTRAATEPGARISAHLGFEFVPDLGLHRFRRHRNRTGAETAVA